MAKLEVRSFISPPLLENGYLVWDSDTRAAYIIDPGGQEAQISAIIQDERLSVKAVIATHGHIDHIYMAAYFQETCACPFWVHEYDEHLVNRCEEIGEMFGISGAKPPRIDAYIKEGDVLTLSDSFSFHVFETPGHSQGSCSLYVAQAGLVFVGDVIFNRGVGRTDLPGGSFETLRDNIRHKLYTLPNDTIVYSGHGISTTIGDEKKHNPFVSETHG